MLIEFRKSAVSGAIVTMLALALAGCGGGGGDDTSAVDNPPPVGQGPDTNNPPPNDPGPGNQTPVLASSFTATGPSDVWHSMSASDDGQVMVAGQASLADLTQSGLTVSRDGGLTWADVASAGTGIWISSDVSANGNRIVAVEYNGDGMVMSNDGGQSFAPVPLPAGLGANPSFESVTIAKDGSRIAAAIQNGTIIVGTVSEAGVSWIVPVGLPAAASWRSIDSSSDGMLMVAVGQDPIVYTSNNGGATWAPMAVNVDGAEVLSQNWYRVKMSDDGQTIAMVGNDFGGTSGDGIYVSKDGGSSFTRANDLVGDYSSLSMSNDGGVIVATVSDRNAGGGTGTVLMSADGGVTFNPVTVTGATETDWRAAALSGDATRLAVVPGRFLTGGAGPIYLSTGTRPQ